jgi:hypothetical protein
MITGADFWLWAGRILGGGLIVLAVWFIPRNLGRALQNSRREGWTRRRTNNVIGWIGIIIGYAVSGGILLTQGWLGVVPWLAFAFAMLMFIPVPCHINQLNSAPGRQMRRMLFIAAAALAASGPMILNALGI